jgi:hypothetical protein
VLNTKVVDNIQIYLHAKLHIFLRPLGIFPIFISLLLIFQFGKGIKYWEKNCGSFPPSRPVSTDLPAQPTSPNWPALFPPPSCYQAGPSASWTPRASLTPSRAGTVTQTDPLAPVRLGKPIPFLCSTPPVVAGQNSHQLAAHASPSSRRVDARHTPCHPVLSSRKLMNSAILLVARNSSWIAYFRASPSGEMSTTPAPTPFRV